MEIDKSPPPRQQNKLSSYNDQMLEREMGQGSGNEGLSRKYKINSTRGEEVE
jgi:hypothetical protein